MDFRTSATTNSGEPRLVTTEEPQQHGQRFRYKCEGRSAGSIQGENSKPERKSVPSVQIQNYNGPGAIVVVSCVSKDHPYAPHPHSLVGNDCKDGVCTIRLRSGQTNIQLSNIGIQCCRRQDVAKNLEQRQKLRVDPFGTGYPQGDIDLGVVRLCYQAFLPDSNKRFTRIVQPIVSKQIFDKKTIRELIICRLSATSGSVVGGEEVFLLCEKVNKDDIQVRFFEENEDGIAWEGYGEFTPQDVHRQVAIVFKTPAYRDQNITSPVTTYIQLRRQSDDEMGDPKPFIYRPRDPDPDGIEFKKRKLNERSTVNFLNDNLPLSVLQHIKDEPELEYGVGGRPRMKPVRKINKPAAATGAVTSLQSVPLPQYSYANLGTDSSGQLYLPTMDASVLNLMPDAVPRDGAMMGPMPDLSTMSLDRSSFDAFLKSFGVNENVDAQELSVLTNDEMMQLLVDNTGSSNMIG